MCWVLLLLYTGGLRPVHNPHSSRGIIRDKPSTTSLNLSPEHPCSSSWFATPSDLRAFPRCYLVVFSGRRHLPSWQQGPPGLCSGHNCMG